MRRVHTKVFCAVTLLAAGAYAASHGADKTALDRYVAATDPNYRFELVKTIPGSGYTAFVLDMTSQSWRTSAEVDRPVWKHWLTIIRPDTVKGDTAFLFITGGSVNDNAPEKADPANIDTAVTTNTVVAVLNGVPNEPLTFSDDKKRRSEDAIIAYTWDKYMRTGDETWPLRLPMTKAAVRAMDTVTTFCAGEAAGKLRVERFVVAGGSKRGWTTWTTAVVDHRVVAIVPMVIDMLNLEKSSEHRYRAYGFSPPSIKDYEDMGIWKWAGTAQYRALMKIEEPYEYRDRLKLPKFLINSAGDQYFVPDSSRFYFDDLQGEKYLRYVPNTNHSLSGSDARQSLIAYYDAFLRGAPRPRFSWKFEKDGAIRVKTIDKPAAVTMWTATNSKARDFRLLSIGPAYKGTPLTDRGGGLYVGTVSNPPTGWTAFFIELTYPSGGKYPFKFTTAVRIAPDTLPFPPRALNVK
jgi:PhoPQ-activated pathogenicity-related protein